jgi:hypothetical protein
VTCDVALVVVQVRIDKFTIEADPQQLPGGTRYYLVKGEAVERFAQVGLLMVFPITRIEASHILLVLFGMQQCCGCPD